MTYTRLTRWSRFSAVFCTLLVLSACPKDGKKSTTLKYGSDAQTLKAGQCSAPVVIQNLDGSGAVAAAAAGRDLSLSGSYSGSSKPDSVKMTFFSDAGCVNAVNQITIQAGEEQVEFYVQSAAVGTWTVNAQESDGKFLSQQEEIVASDAARLRIVEAPQSGVAGVALAPVRVQIEDQYGNRVISATSSVHLSLGVNPGNAVLRGATEVTAGAGTADFNDVSVSATGAGYTLVASSDGLADDSSAPFTVTAAAPSPTSSPTPTPIPTPTVTPTPTPTSSPSPGLRAVPDPLYGVTLDTVQDLASEKKALQGLPHMPTARIVFDEFVAASEYSSAVSTLRPAAYLMGELLDSEFVKQYTVNGYSDRTTEYLNAFGSQVDIWEVGNEINGEWLGTNADVVAKMTNAYNLVKARGYRAELTLYYNEDFWSKPANEMFTWAEANVPAAMKAGLDYVLVSYYEEDCNNLRPDWPVVFDKLARMFPNSKIGFGESGTSNASAKADYINRYYGLKIAQTHYVGGYFWWYFAEDMVPMTKSLWTTLKNAMLLY